MKKQLDSFDRWNVKLSQWHEDKSRTEQEHLSNFQKPPLQSTVDCAIETPAVKVKPQLKLMVGQDLEPSVNTVSQDESYQESFGLQTSQLEYVKQKSACFNLLDCQKEDFQENIILTSNFCNLQPQSTVEENFETCVDGVSHNNVGEESSRLISDDQVSQLQLTVEQDPGGTDFRNSQDEIFQTEAYVTSNLCKFQEELVQVCKEKDSQKNIILTSNFCNLQPQSTVDENFETCVDGVSHNDVGEESSRLIPYDQVAQLQLTVEQDPGGTDFRNSQEKFFQTDGVSQDKIAQKSCTTISHLQISQMQMCVEQDSAFFDSEDAQDQNIQTDATVTSHFSSFQSTSTSVENLESPAEQENKKKTVQKSAGPRYELSSEEEPFQESEDEYIPSTSEVVSESLSDSSNSSNEKKKRAGKKYEYLKSKNVRRKLFSKNVRLQESDNASTSTIELSNDYTRKKKDIGVLRVQDNRVELKLREIFHFGKLHCELIKLENEVLLTYIQDERDEEHTCVYSGKSECMFMRNNCTGELSTRTCISPRTMVGTEHHMSTKHFITSLTDNELTNMNHATKKHHCFYCGVMRKHITDHLKTAHSNEEEVRKAQNLPAKSKEKIQIFQRLRNLGDRLHDNKVLPKERIPTRRPAKYDVSEFLCCENCKSLISPLNFARHDRKCTKRPANYRHVRREKKNEILSKTLQETSTLYDKLLDELLNPLQDDEISHLIRCDTALRAFARHYCMSGNLRENKGKNTRMQLRLLARLFESIQSIDESIMEYKDVLIPEKYDVLIQAVLRLTKANFQTGSITKSSTCLLLRSCIKNLADILKLHYVQLVDKEKYRDDIINLENFISVHESRYKEDLNKIAYESRANTRALKSTKLPTISDVRKFTKFVEGIAGSSYDFLECKGFDYKQWLNLGKSVLILLLVFNRRRIGETSKMRIELYHQREKVKAEDRQHMNRLELLLSDHFSVMKLIAKRVRQLTILLTAQHIRYLDMFLKYRTNAGVSDDNVYLFGVPNNIRYIDASNAIRKFSEICGAEEPKTLRATLFRKQVATLSQMLQLNDNEIQQLADFMGHKVEVHKKYYRSPAAVQEVTVLSKFFMAVGDSNIGRFREKSLSDLEVLIENDREEAEGNINAEEPDIAVIGLDVEQTDRNVLVQQEANLPPNAHLPTGNKPSLGDHTHSTERAKSTTPKKTPRKTPSHTMEHLLNFSIKRSPRRVPFSKTEKDLIYQYFGKYIESGTYPPKQMEQYSSMLKKHEEVFHKKRTVRHIYSFIQYRIKAKN